MWWAAGKNGGRVLGNTVKADTYEIDLGGGVDDGARWHRCGVVELVVDVMSTTLDAVEDLDVFYKERER